MRLTANFQKGDKERVLKNINAMATDDDFSPAFRRVGQIIRFEVEGRIPKDTRELVESWNYQHLSDKSAEFGFDIDYGAYQHEGGDGKDKVIVNRPAGGESYYLTNAINAKKSQIEIAIGKFVQEKIFKNIK
jgi:hypothetical protein